MPFTTVNPDEESIYAHAAKGAAINIKQHYEGRSVVDKTVASVMSDAMDQLDSTVRGALMKFFKDTGAMPFELEVVCIGDHSSSNPDEPPEPTYDVTLKAIDADGNAYYLDNIGI